MFKKKEPRKNEGENAGIPITARMIPPFDKQMADDLSIISNLRMNPVEAQILFTMKLFLMNNLDGSFDNVLLATGVTKGQMMMVIKFFYVHRVVADDIAFAPKEVALKLRDWMEEIGICTEPGTVFELPQMNFN